MEVVVTQKSCFLENANLNHHLNVIDFSWIGGKWHHSKRCFGYSVSWSKTSQTSCSHEGLIHLVSLLYSSFCADRNKAGMTSLHCHWVRKGTKWFWWTVIGSTCIRSRFFPPEYFWSEKLFGQVISVHLVKRWLTRLSQMNWSFTCKQFLPVFIAKGQGILCYTTLKHTHKHTYSNWLVQWTSQLDHCRIRIHGALTNISSTELDLQHKSSIRELWCHLYDKDR